MQLNEKKKKKKLFTTDIENFKTKPLTDGEFLKTLLSLKVDGHGGCGGVRALTDVEQCINSSQFFLKVIFISFHFHGFFSYCHFSSHACHLTLNKLLMHLDGRATLTSNQNFKDQIEHKHTKQKCILALNVKLGKI
jgi:hypothetical protein